MKYKNVVKYYVYFGLVMIGLAAVVLGSWSYLPNRVLEIHNDPVPVHPTVQVANELVFAHVDYCKLKDVNGVIRRSLVSDRERVFLPLQNDTSPKGCQTVDMPVLIPLDITPGTYHVHWDVTYQVNPVKAVVEQFDSEEFTIK